MATYPSTLPKPITRGFQLQANDMTLRTDMEVGAARVRRRTAARNDILSVSLLFTDAQMAAFRTWFEDPDEADGGASWFNVRLPTGDGGVSDIEARFVGAYQATCSGGLVWQVSGQWEVRYA